MKQRRTKYWVLAGLVAMLGWTLAGCADSSSSTAGNDGTASSTGGSIGKQVDYKIIGIDAGAGIMQSTEAALKDYELTDWKLIEGSGAAMTAALDKAIKKQEPIIITGWTPHWMFAKYELKYLEDPKGIYGGDEEIHTIARKGLKEDEPSAYKTLDRFEWTAEDMAKVMVDIHDGQEPKDAATAWIEANTDKVQAWTSGVDKVEGKKLKLGYVAWDSEIASTNIIASVLENEVGYKVDLIQVEAGPMWTGVANGDVDAIVAAWLPTTHKDYYERFQNNVDDLGSNLNGTKIGLVVPSYVSIQSIEDLKK
ncbi:glycine/betaine ABC transporter [Paenibacillus sp. MER 180]|uniref:glycine betaine ABC transporter substrate-binding protein n=1 Tax=Paenibacillus sp. MER 180 TaxID=2939570 RepID=UPI00203EA9A2|nr:glycine betaine ABC transporter substrate-binding protein [Paenibacillus sp. MER 180]MCM3289119.1 glycine/betaine ABC transporter [Paenibacillus sp. MER 180]